MTCPHCAPVNAEGQTDYVASWWFVSRNWGGARGRRCKGHKSEAEHINEYRNPGVRSCMHVSPIQLNPIHARLLLHNPHIHRAPPHPCFRTQARAQRNGYRNPVVRRACRSPRFNSTHPCQVPPPSTQSPPCASPSLPSHACESARNC